MVGYNIEIKIVEFIGAKKIQIAQKSSILIHLDFECKCNSRKDLKKMLLNICYYYNLGTRDN
jgi:hypothetical protein